MSLIDSIDTYISLSKEGVWSLTSSKREIRAFLDSSMLTLESFEDETFRLTKWNENGQVVDVLFPGSVDSNENKKLYELFDAILSNDANLKRLFIDNRNIAKDNIVSLYKLLCNVADLHEYPLDLKDGVERFRVYDKVESYFVEPFFSQQLTTSSKMCKLEDADVVVITAPGATGKSTLTKYISSKNHIPIYDLSKEGPVGSNTLLGLLFKEIGAQNLSSFILGLKEGKTSIVIDALDEAYSKTKHSAFESFLDDIVNLAKGSKRLPFIILGRPSILEFSTLYLEDNGLKVASLQIEPFIKEKALEFITKRVFNQAYVPAEFKYYKPLCDYLLTTIEGFFGNTSSINKDQSQRFIGYAPVLMAVSKLLFEKKDYHNILEKLLADHRQNMLLILDVVEYILNREKGKVEEQIKGLIEQRSIEEQKSILQNVYSPKEQCIRILKKILGKESVFDLVKGDDSLNAKYEECVHSFLDEHPFLENKKIQNIVFESYLITYLINDFEYADEVIEYVHKVEKDQSKAMSYYMLYGIFKAWCEQYCLETVDYRLIPYLLLSYQSLDRVNDRSSFELLANNDCDNSSNVLCSVFFSRANDDYKLSTRIPINKSITLGKLLSNVTIDVPTTVSLDGTHVELSGNIAISAERILILSDDIVLSRQKESDNIVLQAKNIECTPTSGNMPQLSNTSKANLCILTSSDLYYPYVDYRKKLSEDIVKDDLFLALFQKIRRTMLLFRPNHGALSISASKIDSRIGKSKEGKLIISALLKTKVIHLNPDGQYYLDYDKEAEVLGSKYDDLRTCNIVPKMCSFIQNEIINKLG